jgi:hypothetical protein
MADTILDGFFDYMIAEGLARNPKIATAGKHPLWIEPADGVPGPGEGSATVEKDSDLVLGAFQTTGLTTERYESFMRVDSITVWIRSRKAYMAHEFEPQLQEALHDKRNWTMGMKNIIESLMFRPMQRVSSDAAQGFVFSTEYLFWHYNP